MTTTTGEQQQLRVGSLRPNQLLHTYGVGAMADLPNLSVVMLGLDYWNLQQSQSVHEERLLTAVRAKLGGQVNALRLPPYVPETGDPLSEWAHVGVPVGLFPTYLRCTNCNRLGCADGGFFKRRTNSFNPERTRYVHDCDKGKRHQVAVPARFVLACDEGHLDDFPWQYFVHQGAAPEPGHSLKVTERGSTGEAADVLVSCDCATRRPMSDAFGEDAPDELPMCRGRHPHLGTFEDCGKPVRTLVLGATNSWFPMRLSAITLPRNHNPVDHLVSEYSEQLGLLTHLDVDTAKQLMQTQSFWPQLEPYGVDRVWEALTRLSNKRSTGNEQTKGLDLRTPEWSALTADRPVDLPEFTTKQEDVPRIADPWLERVVLVPRLREVAALYGFTRIDAPEWEVQATPSERNAPLSCVDETWVPCAEMRGEGVFLQFDEDRLARWERQVDAKTRERQLLVPAYRQWCAQRQLPANDWPGLRYVLLHTFSHVLIRQLALESGYSASGISERIYASASSSPMAGILLYTAAPDSEGTLGGLVSLGRSDRLGQLIERALDSAKLCSSDPLCAEHDPTVHGRLYGAACHACLFASETSCERGNQYLDRALLVDTLSNIGLGFLTG